MNLAAIHDRDPIAHAHRLDLIVCDEDGRDAGLLLQPANLRAHVEAQPRVQVGQRFVQQEHAWATDQGPRQRHALLLTTGKVRGQTLEQVIDLEHGRDFVHPAANGCARFSLYLEREGDVVEHVHVWIQSVGLEHDADVAPLRRPAGDVFVAEEYPPAIDNVQPAHGEQRRRFAAARRTEQREHLAVLDFEIHRIDDGVFAEALGKVFDQNAHQPLVPPP